MTKPKHSDDPNEPHRVLTVDLQHVLKAEYPDLATAQIAAKETQAKYGGLWFACNSSYFTTKTKKGTK